MWQSVEKGGAYLSVGGNRRLALLLIVFRVRVFPSADGSFVDLDARVTVLHHQSSVSGCFLAVFGDFGFHHRLN